MTNNAECYTEERSLSTILERHERERFAFLDLTEPEKARAQIRALSRYSQDCWSFLRDCTFTLDQVSQDTPIKPFPSYLEYTEFLCHLWLTERLIAVPKSRRMICSWTFISCFTHDTIFNQGRFNGFVSKKEDDSAELVARSEFIYNHIPEWRIPRALLPRLKNNRMSKQPPLLEFEETNSKIQGFPQGADQLRQFTFSGLLFDEWAFWDGAQAAYASAKPTLDGGGRLSGISSRSPGFFKKVVFDKLDAKDLNFREVPPAPIAKPLEGVEVWRNPRNRFIVVDLHYTANPAKRGTEWREAVKASLPTRDYLMEYEKSWQTFDGRPVYEDFNRTIHVPGRRVVAEPGLPLLIGWDFGLTPAAVLCQLVGRRLRIIREFIEDAGSISKLAPVVYFYLLQNYLPWFANGEQRIKNFVDPAGFQKAQTDERTCVEIMRCCADLLNPQLRLGFTDITPGPIDWETRRRSVENYLTQTYAEGPGLEVDDETCPVLIEGFSGGYRYPDKVVDVEPAQARPIKNKYSHPHDGLQYVAHGATALLRAYSNQIHIPTPSYGFQKTEEKPRGR